MDGFKRETSIMDGRGESEPVGSSDWDESKHPRDEDGRFTEKGAGTAKSGEKEKSIQNLVNALRQVKKIKMKELVEIIKSFDPINLRVNNQEIIVEFDIHSAKENIFGDKISDKYGYNYKLNNVEKLPKIIKTSRYSHSSKDSGKKIDTHKGVLQWLYFNNEIQTDEGIYKVNVNIRDKGEHKFVYLISFKKKN